MPTDMHSNKLSGAKPGSTQSFLDIAEIKEGAIVLKDGSMRGIIAVSSTNFSLKSAEEQNALVASYQSFLNSLNFPIQILMQSRQLDIHSYLDKLRSIMQQQTNELLRLQTQEYIEYVGKLIEYASIMNKNFYVVVPYSTAPLKAGFMHKFSSIFNPVSTVSIKEQDFQIHREELYKRINQAAGGLPGMGLRSIILNTEELIELIYNSYNFNAASPIKIGQIDELDIRQS